MRRQIMHPGSGQLRYMIREIVQLARRIEACGQPVIWENIGDPVQKGEAPPDWMRAIVSELASDSRAYAYSDTQGEAHTRAFLAELANTAVESGSTPDSDRPDPLSADDIIFFNGLGDAVSKIFGLLRPQARVIGPSPAYSTHSSAEAAHSGYEPLCYHLDPGSGWLPDLEELENTVRYNPSIAGILIINPDNPTGTVYPRRILEGFVDIARRYDLFIICDETYARIVYGGAEEIRLGQIIGTVPGIAMRSVSKEFPWPGARCGWIEVYNRGSDPDFDRYISSIVASKRLEVCSTTLPQMVIPRVMNDPRYPLHLDTRNATYAARAEEASRAFGQIGEMSVNLPRGGFFLTPVFAPGFLTDEAVLPIENPEVRRIVEEISRGAEPDARFVYYLLGSTGVCVVPLSGFCSRLPGFRMTILETDDALRGRTLELIAGAVSEYR